MHRIALVYALLQSQIGGKCHQEKTKVQKNLCRGPGHFEVDVDVGSSRAAASVVGLVSPVTTGQVIDMAIVLEGREEQELPEQLLGTVRFTKVDMKSAVYLDTSTGKIHPKGT